MASVFPVRGRPTSEGISKRISLTNSTILEQPSFGRKGKKAWEYGGFCIASKSSAKCCSIKTWTNCMRERSRRWGRNQDFMKTPASKCIKAFLFIIKLMHFIFSVWLFSKTALFLAPRICKHSHSARSNTVDCDSLKSTMIIFEYA